MNEYQIIVVIIVMFTPIVLILSTLRHIKSSTKLVIKQGFELLSLSALFFLETILLGFAILLFFLSIILMWNIYIQKYDFWVSLFLVLFGVLGLTISFFFFKSSIYFFRHVYFESSRTIYFDKEANKIISIKNEIENHVNLNSPDLKIIKYVVSITKLKSFGKTEIYDGQNKIVLSDVLDLTPELNEKIINESKKIIVKVAYTWI